MKFFMCLLAVGAALAAPAEESARDKRGIFGEPGGLLTPHLHADPLLGAHLHAPALHAPVVHSAPIVHSAPVLRAPVLHSAPLLRAPVLHAAPVLRAPVVHAPLLASGLHHHDLHDHALLHDLHHHSNLHAPIITSHSHSSLLHHDFHHDLHHDLHHDILHHDVHHAPLVLPSPPVLRVRTLRAPVRHVIRSGW